MSVHSIRRMLNKCICSLWVGELWLRDRNGRKRNKSLWLGVGLGTLKHLFPCLYCGGCNTCLPLPSLWEAKVRCLSPSALFDVCGRLQGAMTVSMWSRCPGLPSQSKPSSCQPLDMPGWHQNFHHSWLSESLLTKCKMVHILIVPSIWPASQTFISTFVHCSKETAQMNKPQCFYSL